MHDSTWQWGSVEHVMLKITPETSFNALNGIIRSQHVFASSLNFGIRPQTHPKPDVKALATQNNRRPSFLVICNEKKFSGEVYEFGGSRLHEVRTCSPNFGIRSLVVDGKL